METLYLTEHGLYLKKKSNRILVRKDGKVIEEVPILNLKRVVIFGNSQLSASLMRHLAAQGVEVAYLSSRSRFQFRLVPDTSKNIYLRIAQHARHREEGYRLSLGKLFVGAKIKNQRSLLMRYQRNQPETDLRQHTRKLKEMLSKTDDAADVHTLMGVEGRAAKAFFAAYGSLLRNGFNMDGRKFHPPPDPVNGMLSFGYMLVFHELQGLLEAHGFDVFLGFLHSVQYGRASLATDLIEEFRSPIVDRLVLYLINKQCIKTTEFHYEEGKGIRMSDQAIKNYLANYERFMTTSFVDRQTAIQTNFRKTLREQVVKLEGAILDKRLYAPFVFAS